MKCRLFVSVVLSVTLLLGVAGCGPGLSNPSLIAERLRLLGATPGVTPNGLPDSAIDTSREAGRHVGGGERITRLTPEQVSKSLLVAFDVGVGLYDGLNLTADYILYDFAIPLGGLSLVDNVRRRDRLTKVGTILVSRQVAWSAARNMINRQEQLYGPVASLFTKCSYTDDRPDGDTGARARWTAQIQDFYRRLFGRDATTAEIGFIEATFTEVYTREGKTSSAWLVIFYSMISTMEAWNTWR